MGRKLILLTIAMFCFSLASALSNSSGEFSQGLKVTILPGGIFLNVISPVEGVIYDNRQVPVEVQFGTDIESFMLTDNDRDFRTLCRNCTYYNQTKPFDDGKHTISIKARNSLNIEMIENISFIVDSTAPKILGLENKKITNGTFSFEFQEENSKYLVFHAESGNLTSSIPLNFSSCKDTHPTKKCNFYINLNQFDGKKINYWYNLTDLVGKSAKSSIGNVIIDTSPPKINSFTISQFGLFSLRFVTIKFNITESNFDSIQMTKEQQSNTTTVFCSSLSNGICQKTKVFYSGDKISFTVTDKAGNKVQTPITTI